MEHPLILISAHRSGPKVGDDLFRLMDEKTCETLRETVRTGKLGAGVFDPADCRKTYEELNAKGVEFMQEPEEKFYGTEALFKDDSGNWFSLSRHGEGQ